ncbi:hypothetical protein [Marinitoga sp. 38H-ov]|uniref:hypothetical protein n=1 Tax=Marinitoga sp. 38H-ov TaxID=1755814 RepID=UPI0013EC5848|nr:hypothetical protein [Marinitoga sp. 38H-ov]KAF2956406.1 hypothetical protein AS160_05730 [Marinitoga sp. 38H-ov]
MKKGIFILLLIIIPYLLFAETYYVIGNKVYAGSLNSNNESYQKELNDKKIIEIKDGTINNEIYEENGNLNEDLYMVGNLMSQNNSINLYKKSHIFEYFIPKDYIYWKEGGRREGINKMELDTLDNTIWYRIHKEGNTENNLYKDFELPFGVDTFVSFSTEIAGLASKSKLLPENVYSASGIIFSFLNENKETIDKLAFAWSSSEYPFKEYFWINPMPLNSSREFNISFNVSDITHNEDVRYIRIIFWTFGSHEYKTLSADLWLRNVKIEISKK